MKPRNILINEILEFVKSLIIKLKSILDIEDNFIRINTTEKYFVFLNKKIQIILKKSKNKFFNTSFETFKSFINVNIINCVSEENKQNREKLRDNFLILLENNIKYVENLYT
tara:strand:- start:262 stop:597 length:336 start_codon:yes stop_codon:yes gene_type:complete